MRRFAPIGTNKFAVDVLSAGSLSCIVETPQYDILIVSIAITGPARSMCLIYAGSGTIPANLLDRSMNGQHDHADYTNGKLLPGASNIIAVWNTIAPPYWEGNPGPILGSIPGSCSILIEFEDAARV